MTRGGGLLHPAGGRREAHFTRLLQEAGGLRQPRHRRHDLRRAPWLRGRLPGTKTTEAKTKASRTLKGEVEGLYSSFLWC